MSGVEASLELRRAVLEPLLADPPAAAILCDLDGTLAPIVARPELVEVPDRARSALEGIAGRYGLCAIVTGRRPLVARELVGLDGIAYIGNHGFELLDPGAASSRPSMALAGHGDDVAAFVEAAVDRSALDRVGVRFEDKGPIAGLHWRGADDEPAAEDAVARIGAAARDAGLLTHRGRKVLELRPAVRIDKGVAVAALLDEARVRAALYAGDDRTDLDAFSALGLLRDVGALAAIARIGVRSPEGPAELAESADLTVAGTAELLELLELLAG